MRLLIVIAVAVSIAASITESLTASQAAYILVRLLDLAILVGICVTHQTE